MAKGIPLKTEQAIVAHFMYRDSTIEACARALRLEPTYVLEAFQKLLDFWKKTVEIINVDGNGTICIEPKDKWFDWLKNHPEQNKSYDAQALRAERARRSRVPLAPRRPTKGELTHGDLATLLAKSMEGGMGRPTVVRTQSDEDGSKVAPAADVEPPQSEEGTVGENEDVSETIFRIERDLQLALRENVEQLEQGLEIIDGGRERVLPSGGRIDITARDRVGTVVVIELKAGDAGRDAVAQILDYMGELQPTEKQVRGILVAAEFSPHAVAAARMVPALELRKYRHKFTFESATSE